MKTEITRYAVYAETYAISEVVCRNPKRRKDGALSLSNVFVDSNGKSIGRPVTVEVDGCFFPRYVLKETLKEARRAAEEIYRERERERQREAELAADRESALAKRANLKDYLNRTREIPRSDPFASVAV